MMVRILNLQKRLFIYQKRKNNHCYREKRPIILATSKGHFNEVAPNNTDLGIMLPYTALATFAVSLRSTELLIMTRVRIIPVNLRFLKKNS